MTKLVFIPAMFLCGCASNKKTLKIVDNMLIQAIQSKNADCDAIKLHLRLIHMRIEEKLKK